MENIYSYNAIRMVAFYAFLYYNKNPDRNMPDIWRSNLYLKAAVSWDIT